MSKIALCLIVSCIGWYIGEVIQIYLGWRTAIETDVLLYSILIYCLYRWNWKGSME